MSELYHHGIKGMRQGIRRYQNEDGTLTEAGRERYGDITKRSARSIRKEATRLARNSESGAAKKIAEVENKIQQEALKKADKTEAGKEYRRVNKTLQELDRQMKEMYGPESQMVLGQEDAMYVNKVYEDYNNTVKKFLKEREDEYYGVYLSVLGYNNTEAGRKYVASILEDWD